MADILAIEEVPAKIKTSIGDDALLQLMITALNSEVSRVASCLVSTDPVPDPGKLAEAKLIMIATLKRWGDAGSGGIQTHQQTAGIYSDSTTIDTRTRPGWKLWPTDITKLQDICKTLTGNEGKAFVVNLGPSGATAHQPWCNLMFGANWCSCGVDLTNGEFPLYEGGEIS